MPRTRVSDWDQGFGCWEFSDMAWVIKKWRRGRACRGAARAASVGRCRSRCVGCMCGRAACAVCRRPAWRRGRRARAAHKYRLPAGIETPMSFYLYKYPFHQCKSLYWDNPVRVGYNPPMSSFGMLLSDLLGVLFGAEPGETLCLRRSSPSVA